MASPPSLPSFVIATPPGPRATAYSVHCPVVGGAPAYLHVAGNAVFATEARNLGREKPRLTCTTIPDITAAMCIAMLSDAVALIGVRGAPGAIVTLLGDDQSEALYFPLMDPHGLLDAREEELECTMAATNYASKDMCRTAAAVFRHNPKRMYLLETSIESSEARVVAYVDMPLDIITLCYTSDNSVAVAMPNTTGLITFAFNVKDQQYELVRSQYDNATLKNVTVVSMANSPKYLICATRCGKLIQFSHKTRSIPRWVDLKSGEYGVNSLSVSLDAGVVALGCNNAIIRIFDIDTLKYRTSLPHPPPRSAMAQRFVDGKAKTIVDTEFADTKLVLFGKESGQKPVLMAVYGDGTLYMWCGLDPGKKASRPSMTLFSHSKDIVGVFPFAYNEQDSGNITYGSHNFSERGIDSTPFNVATVSLDGSIAFWQVTPDSELSVGPELRGLVLNPRSLLDVKKTPIPYTCACSLPDSNLLIVGDAEGFVTVVEVFGNYTRQARISTTSLKILDIDACDTTINRAFNSHASSGMDSDVSSNSLSSTPPKHATFNQSSPNVIIAALMEDGRTILLSYSSLDNDIRKLSFEVEPLHTMKSTKSRANFAGMTDNSDSDDNSTTSSENLYDSDALESGNENVGDVVASENIIGNCKSATMMESEEKERGNKRRKNPVPISLKVLSNGTSIMFLYSDFTVYRSDIPPQKNMREKLFEDSVRTMYLKLQRLGKLDLCQMKRKRAVGAKSKPSDNPGAGEETSVVGSHPITLHKTTTFTQCAIGINHDENGLCDLCIMGEGGIKGNTKVLKGDTESGEASDAWGVLRKYPIKIGDKAKKEPHYPLVSSVLSPDCSHFCLLDSNASMNVYDYWSGLRAQSFIGLINSRMSCEAIPFNPTETNKSVQRLISSIHVIPSINMDMLGYCSSWNRGASPGYILLGSGNVVAFYRADKFICDRARARHDEIIEMQKMTPIKTSVELDKVPTVIDDKGTNNTPAPEDDNELSVNVIAKASDSDNDENIGSGPCSKENSDEEREPSQERILTDMCDDLERRSREAKNTSNESLGSFEKTGKVIFNPLSNIYDKGNGHTEKKDEPSEGELVDMKTPENGDLLGADYIEDFEDPDQDGVGDSKPPVIPQPSNNKNKKNVMLQRISDGINDASVEPLVDPLSFDSLLQDSIKEDAIGSKESHNQEARNNEEQHEALQAKNKTKQQDNEISNSQNDENDALKEAELMKSIKQYEENTFDEESENDDELVPVEQSVIVLKGSVVDSSAGDASSKKSELMASAPTEAKIAPEEPPQEVDHVEVKEPSQEKEAEISELCRQDNEKPCNNEEVIIQEAERNEDNKQNSSFDGGSRSEDEVIKEENSEHISEEKDDNIRNKEEDREPEVSKPLEKSTEETEEAQGNESMEKETVDEKSADNTADNENVNLDGPDRIPDHKQQSDVNKDNDSLQIDFYMTMNTKDAIVPQIDDGNSMSAEILMLPETGPTPPDNRKQGLGEHEDTTEKKIDETSKIIHRPARLDTIEKINEKSEDDYTAGDVSLSKPPLFIAGKRQRVLESDYPTPTMNQSKLKIITKAAESSVESSQSCDYGTGEICEDENDPVVTDIANLDSTIKRIVSDRRRSGISATLRRKLHLLKTTIDMALEEGNEMPDAGSNATEASLMMGPTFSSASSMDFSNMSNMNSEFIETFADIIAEKISRRMGGRNSSM